MRFEQIATGEYSITAIRPWNSPDASFFSESFYDEPQDSINKCLQCYSKPECNNCLASARKERNSTVVRFVQMLGEHRTKREICAELNISRRTYFNYKKAYA